MGAETDVAGETAYRSSVRRVTSCSTHKAADGDSACESCHGRACAACWNECAELCTTCARDGRLGDVVPWERSVGGFFATVWRVLVRPRMFARLPAAASAARSLTFAALMWAPMGLVVASHGTPAAMSGLGTLGPVLFSGVACVGAALGGVLFVGVFAFTLRLTGSRTGFPSSWPDAIRPVAYAQAWMLVALPYSALVSLLARGSPAAGVLARAMMPVVLLLQSRPLHAFLRGRVGLDVGRARSAANMPFLVSCGVMGASLGQAVGR